MKRSLVFMLATSALMLAGLSSLEAQPKKKLYAFANPLPGALKFADHTWITNYDSRPRCPSPAANYWYSTGDCHPSVTDNDPQPLAAAEGDLKIATCIAKPNESTFKPGPATARILYAIDGVCHQICNRILAATGSVGRQPITVEKAHGYKISRFVYGRYGTISQWKDLSTECKVPVNSELQGAADLSVMVAEAGIQVKFGVLEQEQARLRSQIQEIGGSARAGSLRGREVANQVNSAVNASLRRLQESLGDADFQRFFDWPPGQEVVLANPEVASEVPYAELIDVGERRILRALFDEPEGRYISAYKTNYPAALSNLQALGYIRKERDRFILTESGMEAARSYLLSILSGEKPR